MDAILAVDSFPYLVRCGDSLVERHLSEAVRVLKPGGQVAVFNFSYRGDLDADRNELERHAASVGLSVVRDGVRGCGSGTALATIGSSRGLNGAQAARSSRS